MLNNEMPFQSSMRACDAPFRTNSNYNPILVHSKNEQYQRLKIDLKNWKETSITKLRQEKMNQLYKLKRNSNVNYLQ